MISGLPSIFVQCHPLMGGGGGGRGGRGSTVVYTRQPLVDKDQLTVSPVVRTIYCCTGL